MKKNKKTIMVLKVNILAPLRSLVLRLDFCVLETYWPRGTLLYAAYNMCILLLCNDVAHLGTKNVTDHEHDHVHVFIECKGEDIHIKYNTL